MADLATLLVQYYHAQPIASAHLPRRRTWPRPLARGTQQALEYDVKPFSCGGQQNGHHGVCSNSRIDLHNVEVSGDSELSVFDRFSPYMHPKMSYKHEALLASRRARTIAKRASNE